MAQRNDVPLNAWELLPANLEGAVTTTMEGEEIGVITRLIGEGAEAQVIVDLLSFGMTTRTVAMPLALWSFARDEYGNVVARTPHSREVLAALPDFHS